MPIITSWDNDEYIQLGAFVNLSCSDGSQLVVRCYCCETTSTHLLSKFVVLGVGKKEEENNLLRQHVHMYASTWTPMSMPCVGQLFPPTVPSKCRRRMGIIYRRYLSAAALVIGSSLRNYLESRQREVMRQTQRIPSMNANIATLEVHGVYHLVEPNVSMEDG